MDPLTQIADAVGRETSIDGVVGPWDEGNALTFDEALFGCTPAGAAATAWGDEIGSITVGKWADFVVLDGQLPQGADTALEEREVAATYVGGKRVFSRDEGSPER